MIFQNEYWDNKEPGLYVDVIGQAFLAVRLVTRSAALAEEAVLEAIDCEPPTAGDARRLALKANRACVANAEGPTH